MDNESVYERGNESMDYEIEELRLKQNFGLGLLGGILGAGVGAIAWAAISVLTNYQIGWMAIGIGFLVGKSVSYLGRGIDKHYRIIGAIFALAGCLMGNLLTVLIFISSDYGVSFFELLKFTDFDAITSLIVETFEPMDAFFYALAIYEGYKFSVRNLVQNKETVQEVSGN